MKNKLNENIALIGGLLTILAFFNIPFVYNLIYLIIQEIVQNEESWIFFKTIFYVVMSIYLLKIIYFIEHRIPMNISGAIKSSIISNVDHNSSTKSFDVKNPEPLVLYDGSLDLSRELPIKSIQSLNITIELKDENNNRIKDFIFYVDDSEEEKSRNENITYIPNKSETIKVSVKNKDTDSNIYVIINSIKFKYLYFHNLFLYIQFGVVLYGGHYILNKFL